MTTSNKKTALINALAFFLIYSLFLYAIADHPPPRGFIWVIVAGVVLAGLIYYRVPTYVEWSLQRKKNRRLRVMLDGLCVGIVIAVISILFSQGEPGVTPTVLSIMSFIIFFGLAGSFTSSVIYIINALIVRKKRKDV